MKQPVAYRGFVDTSWLWIRNAKWNIPAMLVCPVIKSVVQSDNIIYQTKLKLPHILPEAFILDKLIPGFKQIFNGNNFIQYMAELNSHKSPPPTTSRLPILQHLIKAYLLWQNCLQHVPKKSRYTLGSKIDVTFIETMEFIFMASVLPREKKLLPVERAVVKFDLLKFFLQVAWEAKLLDTKKYSALASSLGDIGKMLGGWHKNLLWHTRNPSNKKGLES